MDYRLLKASEADLRRALNELQNGWSAAFVSRGTVLYRERGAGLGPAFRIATEFLTGRCCPGTPAQAVPGAFADKVLGLAAFRFGCLLGARLMWGEMASSLAVEEGRRRGIVVRYHRLVPAIMNRHRDGLCPMEHLAFQSQKDYQFCYRATAILS